MNNLTKVAIAGLSLYTVNSIASDLETITVTGSRIDNVKTSGQTVLSRADIDNINPLSTIDLLRHIPHLLVSSNGAAGDSFISVRGGESNFTLVMIDGVAVNDPTNSQGGGFDFNQIDPSAIERIEVYRGGVSALYGAEAISGVVHLITRKGDSSSVSIAAGNHSSSNGSLSIASQLNATHQTLLNVARNKVSQSASAEKENKQLLLKLDSVTDTFTNNVLLTYSETDRLSFAEDSGGDDYAEPHIPENHDSKQWLIGVTNEYNFADHTVNSRLSWSRHQANSIHPGIAEGVLSGIPASDIRSNYKKVEAEIVSHFSLASRWKMLAGINAKKATGENEGTLDFGFPMPVDFRLDQETYSGFIETSGQIAKANINLGLRYDNATNFDGDWSTRVAINYPISHKVELLASYSEGFKLPSFFALAHPLIGNPALKAERSKNSELGLSYTSEFGQMEAVAFYNDFTDLVDFDPETFSSVNRQSVNTQGAEFSWQFSALDWLSTQLHVSYLDVDIKGSDSTLRRRPKWSGGISLVANIDSFSIALNARSKSNAVDSSIATGQVNLPGYTAFSGTLNWQYNGQITYSVKVENIFDNDFQESIGFSNTGTHFIVGGKYIW